MTKSARLSTNLVGKKIRIMNDDDAKIAARLQGNLTEDEISKITAKGWFPVLGDRRWQSIAGVVGEIVAVHMNKDSDIVITANFGGELREVPDCFMRIVE